MLRSLEIRNYQSLRKLTLHLGRFTVVTGATGAGKSAVFRAVRLLAFNAKGTSYITTGEKECQVAVLLAPGDTGVSILRGARGKDAYTIVPAGQGEGETFTKLAGKVPAQVEQVLALTELNFAAQFDRPFLLDDSGGTVARILGQLTNVTLLLEAARESNRRRLRVADRLSDARAEEQRLHDELQRYVTLPARQQAVQEAEEAFTLVQKRTLEAARLRQLVDGVIQAQAGVRAAPPPVQLPSFEALDALTTRHARLSRLLADAEAAWRKQQQFREESALAYEAAGELEKQLHDVLREAGTCPLCGQSTKGT